MNKKKLDKIFWPMITGVLVVGLFLINIDSDLSLICLAVVAVVCFIKAGAERKIK